MMRKLLRISLCLSLVLFLGQALGAQDTSKQTTRKARLEQEIAILDGQLHDNAARNSSALNNLSLIQRKIELRRSIIKEGEEQIRLLDNDIRAKQQSIDSLQARLDTMTFYYNRLVKSAYKNRDARVWYMYILSSENLSQGLRRFSFLKNLSHQMNTQGEKIKAAKADLEVERSRMDALRAEAKALQDERTAELSRLNKEEASLQQTIKALQKEKTKYQSQLNAKKKEVEALNREIAKIIADAMGKSSQKKSTTKKPSAPIDYTLAKEFSANKGKLPWPAEGPVVETFGAHYHPVYKQVKLPDSDGISIALKAGTPVSAVFDGVVKNIIVQPGYNKCVLVQHGDFFTFYCKLGSVSVKAGDKVKTGQTLGTVEPIGGTTQLHFQLWSSKGPQDPLYWLRDR